MTDPNGERAERVADIIRPLWPGKVPRFCKNEDCPHLRMFHRRYFIGESSKGAYTRIKCVHCKEWSEWNAVLMVMETGP